MYVFFFIKKLCRRRIYQLVKNNSEYRISFFLFSSFFFLFFSLNSKTKLSKRVEKYGLIKYKRDTDT